MKKIINVITLIVMVSVNVLTPFTYADSFGDVFVETQEIDEIVAENGDFSDEEEIDEISDEDQDDEIDIDEDENESDETDEDSESDEDDTSEEQTEEEGEQTEEDENLIDENNENEEGDTQDSQPDEQSTIDVQNDEEVDDENDFSDEDYSETPEESPIDAVKESIESFSGNILTGDIEFLTGEILTGEVVELTGNDLELSIARETLNEDLIQKSEYYNGVSVNVEAQPGTFPQGTELRINPVIGTELSDVKSQISDKDENISEESLVAFDISFIYILSGGEEIEVQPKNGDGVKVVFNYENNENLSEADNNDGQKVKVFHIDDKDDEGNKVEKGEEVVKDVTNRVESEENGIAVADAESFSVYVLVSSSSLLEPFTVTYNLNGGYWTEEGEVSTGNKNITYEYDSTVTLVSGKKYYKPTSTYKTPSKAGNTCNGKKCMFKGWYTDIGGNNRWNGTVSSDMTVYAKWLPFDDLHVYFLVDHDNIIHETIMDRNLGATEIYSQDYSHQNVAARGDYFQWGNNYAFGTSINGLEQITDNTRVPVSIWELGVPSKYYSSVFYKKDKETWTIGNSKLLWGGDGDTDSSIGEGTTYTGRQGPCPDGYHIPSAMSRRQLFNNWNQAYNYDYSSVMNISPANNNNPIVVGVRNGLGKDLLLPPAGRWGGTSLSNTDKDLSYWASSHNESDNKTAYGFFVGQFGVQPRGVQSVGGGGDGESRGRSIRCFKNPENKTSYLSGIDLNGGTGGIISILNGEVKSLKEPTRGNDVFRGWYTTSGYSGNPIEIGSTLQQGDSLYAKWCADGSFDDGSQCINGFTITFDSNGGSSVSIQYVTSGETGTRPENPTKDGYSFDGWFIDNETFQNEFDFDIPITSNITIYAKWTPIEYTINYELNGGEVAISNPITYTIETQDFTLHNPSRVGYDFLGWSGTNLPECSVEEHSTCSGTVSIQQGSTGNRVFEAIWDAEKYNLNFDSLGGSEVPTQRIVYGETGTKPLDPEKDGYSFVGWYYTGLENEFDFDTPITSNITVYAKWNLINYHITYELNDGTVSDANPTRYTIESGDITLNNPTKVEYVFEGWSGTNLPECTMEDTSSCEKNVTITQGSTGDKSYEAIWGYIKYDLIFDSIGGSEVESQIVIKGRTGTRPADPEKDGYSFVGWYYTGLETEFDFEEPILSDITIYAKWNLIDYHITYNLNGGTGLTNTGIYTIETDSFTLNNPSKLNYEFIGWSGTNLSGCSVENQTTCNTTVTVEQGSVGNRVYEAIYDCAYGRKLDGTCNIVKGEDGLIDYENWEYNDLEVDLSVTDPVKIVIMDRNLGAAVSGVEENAFGFYYQWGNNYGFRNVIEKTSTEQVDASAYGPENYYISDTFILQDSSGWDAPVNYDLWGGTGDTTSKRGDGDDEARQGPCPSGYHVPSILEWHKLNSFANTWRNSENATDVCSEFDDNRQCVLSKFLKLPRAGNILGKDGSFQPYDGGYLGRYWSSSRHNDDRAYRYRINGNWDISQGLPNNTNNYSYYNSQGMSVRCFKNVSSKPIVYELSGGVQTGNQTSTVVWWNESAGKTLTIPTKTGFVFEGWYLTSGYEKGTRVTKNVISDYSDNESVILYANWKNPEYKTIIYNANGGYFSGGLLSTGIVFKEHTVSGNYMALTNVQFPNREGYMFDGWYLTGGETEWTGYVNNSTEEQTVYAKWLSFDDLTVTMSGITFTLMDRNLGATDFATGYTYGSDNEQNNQSRRGKYYQWGNNYGFSGSGNPSGSTKINNTDNFGPGNYFSNAVYIWNGRVWGTTNSNLWGGQYPSSGDETRQGPCPVNYHVPTKDEWDRSLALFNVWKQTEEGITYCNSLVNSGDMYCFSAKLGLPFAGYLEGANNLKSIGTFGTYWSSTKSGYTDPYRLRLGNMRTETLSNGYGTSVRCFKDTQKKELNFDSKGGSEIASMQTVRWWEATTSLPTPTRANSTFTGWYMTSGYEEGTKVSVNYIGTGLGPVTLYAKWECNEGYEESEDGNSCTSFSYTITYDSTTNGGTKEEQTEGVEYGAHPSLSLYTGYKEGWTFVGWNTNSGATYGLNSDEITITSDIILYAIYRKEAKILEIVSYPLNGDGITYNEGHDYGFACTLPEVFNNEEQDTSCTVSMPFVTINDWSRREFIGVNSDSGATENASNIVWETYDYEIPGFKTPVYSGTITLTEETSGKKWYIISKYPSLILTGNFHGNGSTILGEISTGCTIGEIYNKAQEITSCEVDMPRVTPNTNTPTFVGWNTNSGATENDGVSYNNITNKLTLSLANGEEQDWYAITKSSEIRSKLYMHLNGNDMLIGGTVFEGWSHNDDSDSSDVKVIFDLCKIPSSYNGNQQFPYCTQEGTMFTFTPNGTKTAIGWSATSGTGSEIIYTPGQTNVTLTGYKTNPEIHLYAQSVLTGSSYSVIFSGNGAKMGTSESDEITLTCKGENSYNGEEETKSKECNVKTPSIIREGYTIQGYTGDNSYETEDSNLITGGSSLKLSSINNGNTYYVSSYKPATIIFDKNGNAAQIKSGLVVETIEDVVEICNIWNRKENCRITTPEIIPAVGKAVKGYSTSGTTYENEIAHKTLIDVTESRKYYAWSEYSPVKYTANFEIGTGVEPIVETSGSCMTEVKYNSEEIESSCKVQLPELTAQVGYTNPKWYSGDVEVVLDGERKTTISGDVEFTAKAETHNFTVAITVNNDDYGRVTSGLVEAQEGVEIATSGNELTIGDEKVIAIATGDTAQYSYEFSGWNNNCGNVLSGDCTIEVEFERSINTYTITFHSNEGSVVTGQTKQYGSHVDEPADPTRQGYGFSGWYSNISLTQKYNFTETVTGDLDLYAKWTPITYTIGYELNGGVLPAGQENPTTYTIESNDITLKNPTRIGYIFSGWTGTDLSTESTEVTIASGSMGDRVYYANWQPDNVNVTVYYFTQKLNPSTNELIDEFDTHDIRIVQMQSDLEFNIYNEFYKPIEGFEYVRATVTEQDTSEHAETTTTVLPNGSRVINLYYTRGQYNFAIIPVDNVTTQGSSENSGYYYGATITLSGSSSNDCFMWSGWTNLPEGTINNSQTSFTMPANAISLSGVVTEKTYNISFNGNGADEGEMETLNGISCTQSIYLPINKFKKVGHTFTGWTTTIDGSKEYNDGARIQALTTGNNTTVNLIAVWDINKYDIVWKNYNGETLDSQILEYGVIPEYGGEHPLRDPDIQFSYSFSGWTPEIQRVEGPQVYTAVYSTTLNEYTITWDVDGTITTETYEYGAIPYFSGSKGKVPDKQYIYTFSGWTPQISPVSGNITYTATYTTTLRKYTVTWINSNGDVLETDENVPYGTTPTYDGPTPTKEGDTEHHYTFAGWAPAVGPISGDTTYEAIFDSTKKEYTIIWQNENGGILETDENVPYGTIPSYDGPTPTKASDPHYSYEFAGWTPETGAVVGHQTYTATYTAIPRKYTVTWKNSNGSVIRTDTGVEYGTTLEYQGPTPTSGGNAQYSYEFTGWNPAIGEIHGDTTYTAVYTHKTNKYTITWKNRDGTVIKTVTGVEYGATPIYGDVSPTKTGDAQYSYEFIGWEPGISTVTGDTSYTAKFKENLNRYKVIFINDDSGILKEATEYDYGTSRNDIEKPTDPTKASDVQYSYEFAGWEPSISVLTGDITFKATYTSTVNKYTVTWKNRNGSIIKTNTGVEYGTEPEYDGPTPTKESTSEYSYRFTGWEPAIGEIHGDTTYTAQFEPILESYTITWKDRDGKVLKVDENVPYGATPVYSGDNPSRSGNIQYDYIFDGWTPSLVPVHGDATYTAKYRSELKKYKVIWKNWDDEVLETDENVLYGSTPKYDGEEPTKPGSPQYSYVFDRWTPNIHAVDGDVVYKAVFEELINKYTVTWENWDESVIKTDTGVEYGTVLEYDGPTPTKEGDAQYSYEFSGWDNEIKAIHEDTTYRATYIQSVNEYLITFLDGDGKTIQTGMVAYGATPNYTGSTPTKAKTQEYTYTFNNTWSPEIHSVGGEETYTAQFNSTKNKYTITINANTNSGSINTGLITAEYGTPITESGNELKIGDTTIIATAKPSDAQYTHEFSGWNNTCGLTLNDGCIIEAEFRSTVNKYLITFLDGDGKVIQTGMVAYGTTPNYTGSTPTKTKTQEYTYTFNGNWSPAIHSVTTGETYTAQFNSTKNKYTITINANTNSGSINTGLITAEYGTPIIESGNELKIGDTTIIATAKPSDAQYTHEFSGWNNSCGLTLNDGCIIEAEFRSTVNEYLIRFIDGDGKTIQTGMVVYGETPAYTGTETPTKTATAQYTYEFNGTWDPSITAVTTGAEYIAQFTATTNKYTITIGANTDSGSVSSGVILAEWGSEITTSGNELKIGETTVIATPHPRTAQYTYEFSGWNNSCGATVTTGCRIEAEFRSTVNEYTVTWKNRDGTELEKDENVLYGTMPSYDGSTPTKPGDAQYTYTFKGWSPATGMVEGNVTYTAQYNNTVNKYTIIWQNEDGTELEKDENVPYGTTPSYDGSTPTKPGDGSGDYVFNGWNPSPISVIGDAIYTAKYKEKVKPEDDSNKGQRRSGGGRRHYTSDDKQHGSAEDIDNPSDSEKEVFDAYKRAYKYGITTIDNEQEADPDGYVTRGHLAKMVVNFTVNALGREMPVDTPTKCKRKDKDSEWESNEIKFYAEKACALGVMGLYTEEFMPNKIVDRAEFGTVISRLLWGNRYDELDTDNNLFYTKHLKALQESGFMKDIDNPLGRKEFRKRVWVTLKRIELEKNKK